MQIERIAARRDGIIPEEPFVAAFAILVVLLALAALATPRNGRGLIA